VNNKKVVIIGLDGMSPELFDVLVKRGVFPTLGKLRKNGAYTKLQSTLPPTTAPAWTTFATGVNPGKHGIYDFLSPHRSLLEMKPISSEEIMKKTFYQTLEDQGKRGILVNLPVSWPPLTKNPTITSLLTRGEKVVFPKTLFEKIPQLKNYQLFPESFGKKITRKNNLKLVSEVRDLERKRLRVFMKMIAKIKWDFSFILFSGSDWLSHRFYRQLISGCAGKEVWRFFQDIDSYVREIYNKTKKDSNFFILSDHGFKIATRQFAINQWLFKEGYLLRRKKQNEEKKQRGVWLFKKPLGFKLTAPSFLLNNPCLFKFLTILYRKMGRYLPISIVVREEIDPRHTAALATQWGIYLNLKGRFSDGCLDESARKRLAKELKRKLEELKDEKTGEHVFEGVFLREEVYIGEALKKAPDVVFYPQTSWQVIALLSAREIFSSQLANDHERKGIFLAFGEDIVANKLPKNVSIEDVCPTILHSLESPKPKNLDGKVLEIFKN